MVNNRVPNLDLITPDITDFSQVPRDTAGNPIVDEPTFALLKKKQESDGSVIPALNLLEKTLSKYATKSELSGLLKACERLFASKNVEKYTHTLLDQIEQRVKIDELINALKVKADSSELDNVKSALQILSNAIDAQRVYTLSVELSSEQILALNSGITLLDCFDDKWIKIECIKLDYVYDTTAYTIADPADKLSVQYETQGEIDSFDVTDFLDQTSNKSVCISEPVTYKGSTPLGEAVVLKMLDNDVTLGDGTLTVNFSYRIKG